MGELTIDDLKGIAAILEGRIHTDNFIKALVPGMNVIGDIASTSALIQKISMIVQERTEADAKKAKEEAKKE